MTVAKTAPTTAWLPTKPAFSSPSSKMARWCSPSNGRGRVPRRAEGPRPPPASAGGSVGRRADDGESLGKGQGSCAAIRRLLPRAPVRTVLFGSIEPAQKIRRRMIGFFGGRNARPLAQPVDLVIGRLFSHGRGRWFNPSRAHQQKQ